ncbi:hypothetical protein GW7_14110, partial [Heterocephalus glaber]
ITLSSFVSPIAVTPSLTMSENFQIPPSMGTSSPLDLSPFDMSMAAPVTSNAPALTSAWLLPSTSVNYFQPVIAGSYTYQHCSESKFSGAAGQRPMSSLAASYPDIWQWDGMPGSGSRHPPLETFTMSVTNQSTTVVSSSMPAHANTIIPIYPSIAASLVQPTLSPYIPNKGQGYHHYNQSAMGPLVSAELGGLQPYEPEIVMVLKEIQHTNVITSASPAICYSGSVQANMKMSFQVKGMTPEIETYMEWQALSQAGFVSQLPEIMESCSSRSTQLLEGRPPTESGGISVGAPVQNFTHSLALDSSWEQPEKENLEPLDVHKIFIGTQDPPLLSLVSPDSPDLLASTEHPISENPGSEDALLGKCHLTLQDPGTLDKGIESSPGWADIGALVEDIQLPQVLQSLEDLDDSNQLTTIGAQDTDSIQDNEMQENSANTKVPSAKVRKKKHQASEAITGAPEAKLQLMDLKSLSGEKGCIFSAAASDRAPKDTVEKSYRTSPMMPSNRTNQDEGHGKGRTKRAKGNNGKKALENKQSEPKVKAEEMPTIPNRKRKRQQPGTGQEVFKMPHTRLGTHLLESVQVFHPLGKKLDKKGGSFSSRALGASSITKDLKISTSKSWPGGPCEGKIPRDDARNPHSTAEAEASSASLSELPPPGQVKLIPLSFPSPEKPPSRPVCRRPQPPASRQPTIAHPVQPAATDTAQPSQTAAGNTSLMHPIKPAQPVLNNASQARLTWKTQPGVPQPAVSKPASRATSPCSSLRRVPVATGLTKQCSSPPLRHHPYLIEDFSRQRIPWREPSVPQPVLSTPITEEQRPEREAMKRQAQLERELAAKYTSLGKLQFFRQRETDMEIAQYYGYVR